MNKLSDYKVRTLEEYSKSLSDYLPGGNAFALSRIPGTTMKKLVDCRSAEMQRVDSMIQTLINEHYPNTTESLITDWEAVVGIPGKCFPVASTLEERRENVLIKLSSLNVQTRDDFINLAALFGFDVEIIGGSEVNITFPYTFPIQFEPSPREDRHTMYVIFKPGTLESVFPYTFPITFGSGRQSIMQCWFESLSPANVLVVFET